MESTNSKPLFVVDASVAVKWGLRDEGSIIHADAVLDLYQLGVIDLVTAECLRYEVAGAIRKAHRTRRVTENEARVALETFLAIAVPHAQDDRLVISAYELSVRTGCSFYDGMYVALAVSLQRPLILADRRLRNALEGHEIETLWLDDWQIRGPTAPT
jgi:predicted nucleic acid-binding protein